MMVKKKTGPWMDNDYFFCNDSLFHRRNLLRGNYIQFLHTRDFVDRHFAVRRGNINSTSFCSFFLCHCLTLTLRERIDEIFRSKGLRFGEIHLHRLNLQKPSAEPSKTFG